MNPDALAANWDQAILADYMAGVQKGDDSDDAMSSGDSDSEAEFEEENSSSSLSNALSDVEIPHPSDIASDDSAFSSEDEFAEEAVVEKQKERRELVLGRPRPAIVQMSQGDRISMHLGYMKQLDDADEELAELTGVPYQPLTRRKVVMGLDPPLEFGDDLGKLVLELRKRSDKEISSEGRGDSLRHLALLAQALFRKERQIKHLQG